MARSRSLAPRPGARCRGEPVESDHPVPHRWVPIIDGTERLGVLRFEFADPLTEDQRRLSDALTSLGGELLVGKRPHTDHYEMQRRQSKMNLAAELQWRAVTRRWSRRRPRLRWPGSSNPPTASAETGSTIDQRRDPGSHDLRRHWTRSSLGVVVDADHRLTTSQSASSSRPGGTACRRRPGDQRELQGRLRHRPGRPAVHRHRQVDVGQCRTSSAHADPRWRRRRRAAVRATTTGRRAPMNGAPTAVETVQLQPSDRVLFYTDGLVEGGRRGGSRFGVERLADLLGAGAL